MLPKDERMIETCGSALSVLIPPPNAPTCPCGLRGLPSWAWQECN